MEERQAVITRVPLPLLPTALLPSPLLRRRFRRRATPEQRVAIPIAEDSLGGSVEGDREVEKPVEDPGSARR